MLIYFFQCMFCLKVSCTMFSSFIYITLILIPWITEIIVVTYQEDEHKIITLLVCGIIQTIISIYGGFRMGVSWNMCCNPVNWSGSPTNYKSLFSPGYVVYFLPPMDYN
jgi:hypothetical protein